MDVLSAESPEHAKEWNLPARKFKGWVHEVEVPLRNGEPIAYESECNGHGPGGRVEFNIHSHECREVTCDAKRRDARIEGTFVAPWNGKSYLMWENVTRHPCAGAPPYAAEGRGRFGREVGQTPTPLLAFIPNVVRR